MRMRHIGEGGGVNSRFGIFVFFSSLVRSRTTGSASGSAVVRIVSDMAGRQLRSEVSGALLDTCSLLEPLLRWVFDRWLRNCYPLQSVVAEVYIPRKKRR